MTIAELEAAPPREPGPLLKKSLRGAWTGQYGINLFVVLIIGGIDVGGLYARSQGISGMSTANLVESILIGAAIMAVTWWFMTRPTTQMLRAMHRDGLLFDAQVHSINKTSRRTVVRAAFKYGSEELLVAADTRAGEAREGDTCHALFDPKTRLGCVVWKDKGLLTTVTPEQRIVQPK